MSGLSYKDAGVDIDKADALIDAIKPHAARTMIPEVLGGIGHFAGLCRLPEGMRDPVLVAGTDGVGTKLLIAHACNQHHSIGIDLVAMSVNDILTCGARPLFFLDYFATAKLELAQATEVIQGIAEGCRQAECALLGGETAEVPGVLPVGSYELAGFAVGVVERAQLIDGSRIQAGDALIGLASNGLHANGYSLARAALLERAGYTVDQRIAALGEQRLGDALLRPTRIYTSAVKQALAKVEVHGLCHITGGGLPGNLVRILPKGLAMQLDPSTWEPPPLFAEIQGAGNVSDAEMRRTFNMGIGFVMVVPAHQADATVALFEGDALQAWDIGRVVALAGHDEATARVTFKS